jgi:lipoic acid synthetase
MSTQRLPTWVTNRNGDAVSMHRIKRMLREKKLHTVCESAKCPNLGECFTRDTATFMILGNHCTRACGFCAVGHSRPGPLDPEEPQRIVEAARSLRLRHIVITSVTRDDLPDGGSRHFAETVRCLRREIPDASIEVLTPDFRGDPEAIRSVVEAGPDVYNHNLETVSRLYPEVRSSADYRMSLDVLSRVKQLDSRLLTKSGMMVGLGETEDEVIEAMRDLRDMGCDLFTIGQYLRPRKGNLPVVEYIPEEKFAQYERIGYELGFRRVMSGPLVRSSFHAVDMVPEAPARENRE